MIIDHNTWVGHWPFRDLSGRGEVAALISNMDRLGIHQAWVSPLDAIFHRTPHLANQRLLEQLSPYPNRLVPIPLLNPTLAETESYLRKLIEEHPDLKGVRIMPAFFKNNLESLYPLRPLLHSLTIMWTVRMVDDRTRHPLFPFPVADPGDAVTWHQALQPHMTVITGCTGVELRQHSAEWNRTHGLSVDSSFLDGVEIPASVTELLPNKTIISGSNFPLLAQDILTTVWHSSERDARQAD